MEEKSTKQTDPSRVVWGELEDWARGKIQDWLQRLLESEVTELLGREKSERREAVDAGAAYRNGYGKRRRLSMTSGTISVRRPRVRGLEGRFESRILPAFKRRTEPGPLYSVLDSGWPDLRSIPESSGLRWRATTLREECITTDGVEMSHPPITPAPRAPALSIVVPLFNEERNVEATVEEIRSKIGPRVDVWEAILVDDGSLDGTAAVAEALAADDRRVRVVRHPGNRGYGAALRSGFAAAAYPLVFYTDGDLQFDLAEIDRLLALVDGADIVTGYRIDRQDPWHRRFNAGFYNATMRLLFGVRVKDLDCAFKIYRKSIFETIAPRSDGILISGEILVEATRQGLVIREVGVTHHPRRAGVATGNKPLVVMAAMFELARFCKRQLLRPAPSTSAERRRRGTTR